MISYAQNGEDVVLSRLFGEQSNGFFIDVGANDPVSDSVTKAFSDRGWTGINIEPVGPRYQSLVQQRPRDINLNVGLADKAGELCFFECLEVPDNTGIPGTSTLSRQNADEQRARGCRIEEKIIPVWTLASVCEQYVDRTIEFLSIDVEGLEEAVIRGGDWNRWRPRVVVVEAVDPLTHQPSHQSWEPVLLKAGYHFALFDGVNRFYLRDEDRHLMPLLAVPANVLDFSRPFRYISEIEALEKSLHHVQGELRQLHEMVGRTGLGIARRLRRFQARFPRTAKIMLTAARGLILPLQTMSK